MNHDHQRILEWLADKEWHCSTELDYMRDTRKRISELNKPEERIEGVSCDGRCGIVHKSKTLKMRRLKPQGSKNLAQTTPISLVPRGLNQESEERAVQETYPPKIAEFQIALF